MDKAFNQSESTGGYLIHQLETRLDNVIYRLGFADSRRQARQLVIHGHFTIGDKNTNIPSYKVKQGDKITWKESKKLKTYVKALVGDLPKRPIPEWLELDVAELTANVRRLPDEADLVTTVDTRLIVEFYSR
jgi:small subunit ribosomal protein S4